MGGTSGLGFSPPVVGYSKGEFFPFFFFPGLLPKWGFPGGSKMSSGLFPPVFHWDWERNCPRGQFLWGLFFCGASPFFGPQRPLLGVGPWGVLKPAFTGWRALCRQLFSGEFS